MGYCCHFQVVHFKPGLFLSLLKQSSQNAGFWLAHPAISSSAQCLLVPLSTEIYQVASCSIQVVSCALHSTRGDTKPSSSSPHIVACKDAARKNREKIKY
jgi:hypothetical protein